ncbi:MAG: helix-hairpin-helix domain-containing protein, partial [Nanoarchaeota archaeon]|nr:helix-hairpin-helix domain-containing protein [Nanoarchaeota archaeon]
ERMLELLKGYEFIKSNEEDFASANELEDPKYEATLIGRRVAQLYLDPLTADHIIKCIKRGRERQLVEFSFLQMVSYTLEMRPLLKVRTAEYDDVQEKIVLFNSNILMLEPSVYESEYDEFLASVKSALFLTDWVDENDEEFLLEKYAIRPGEVRVKIDNANWLLFAAEELTKLLGYKEILKELIKLRLRLKYGVKEELLTLLRLKNIGRVRARKMFNNRIRTVKDLKECDVIELAQLIGKKVAIDVKKQVGIDVSNIKIKENKRKGQISLRDYW